MIMDETGGINVLGFRISVLVVITSLVGGLALVFSYAAGIFSGRSNDASSNKAIREVSERNAGGDRNLVDNESSSTMQNPGTMSSNNVNANGNTTAASGKRAKNKKRREAQQEFAHPWMVGALKGHTGPVLDMNFSSNGKFLASCAEDCDLVPEEEPQLEDASSSNGKGDYVLEEKSHCQGKSVGSGSASSSTATVVTANNNGSKNSNVDSFISTTGTSSSELEKVRSSSSLLSQATSKTIPVAGDRANLSRRQRKNRTRAPREQQQRTRDRDEENDDLIAAAPRHRHHLHRMHHQPDVKIRHRRHDRPRRIDAFDCNTAKSENSNSNRINRKSSEIPKVQKNNGTTVESLKPEMMKNTRANWRKDDAAMVPRINMKNSCLYRNNNNNNNKNNYQSMRNHRNQLNQLSECALACLMKRYVLTKLSCSIHGYPVEFDCLLDCVYIKHNLRPSAFKQDNVRRYHHLDANAREFVPSNSDKYNANNNNNNNNVGREWTATTECEIDSGTGSGSSVENSDQEPECSSDSDKSSDVGESFSSSSSSSSSSYSDDSRRDSATTIESSDSWWPKRSTIIVKHECVRCAKNFNANRETGMYIEEEECVYHWGKLFRLPGVEPRIWECCKNTEDIGGCTSAKMHVWTGLSDGYNGPFYDYVKTRPSRVFTADGNYGVYALDCEMCFTRWGLELTRVTIVDMTGRVIYDNLVKPKDEIIDYNTRFSGITAEILSKATKTLVNVQQDILSFVHAETILIGHGLGNDLRALKILHRNVIDTTVIYPHIKGFPVRRSLKTLARSVLGKEIQVTEHDSVEDARTAAEIMIAKIWSDIC